MTRIHFSQELESVRQDLIQMGETTVSLLGEVLHAVSGDGSASAERASELEARTDHQLRTIHDECLSLITLQAPVARDARLITGILDAIVDLELIGDYCYEIVTICGTTKHRAPSPIVHQVSEIVSGIRSALLTALGGSRVGRGRDHGWVARGAVETRATPASRGRRRRHTTATSSAPGAPSLR